MDNIQELSMLYTLAKKTQALLGSKVVKISMSIIDRIYCELKEIGDKINNIGKVNTQRALNPGESEKDAHELFVGKYEVDKPGIEKSARANLLNKSIPNTRRKDEISK